MTGYGAGQNQPQLTRQLAGFEPPTSPQNMREIKRLTKAERGRATGDEGRGRETAHPTQKQGNLTGWMGRERERERERETQRRGLSRVQDRDARGVGGATSLLRSTSLLDLIAPAENFRLRRRI